MSLHDLLIEAGERAATHDPRIWTMVDARDEWVYTPCCGVAGWVDPLLFTACCAKCGKPHQATPLGIVGGHL